MTVDPGIADALVAAGLADSADSLRFEPLTGGVSSDIWRVDGGRRPLCVKRARKKLAVAADWEVPVERNHSEAEFLRVVGQDVPGFAPQLLAEDEAQRLIALPYFPAQDWTLWKAQLLSGHVDTRVARNVGTHLGRLARATRGRADLARRFDTTGLFHALRLDPYLLECARKHPDLAPALKEMADDTAARREALVHGDVSPKNILVDGARDCLILDAECAWYGDPAFDLAFVVNHLALKSVHLPDRAAELLEAIDTLVESRAAADEFAHAAEVGRRAARLLPGLLLARVDGKSPVEYLTDPRGQDRIRQVARRFIQSPSAHLRDVARVLTGVSAP